MTKLEKRVVAAALAYWKHAHRSGQMFYVQRNLNTSPPRARLFRACATLLKRQS